jgi:HEAT repeat protein
MIEDKKEQFLEIFREFEESETEGHRRSLLYKMAEFVELTSSSEILISIIKEKIKSTNSNDASDVTVFIWVIQMIADSVFVPVLCEILNNYRHFDLMEGIADALCFIADETCIEPIVNFLLEYEIEEDLGYHLRNKFLDVLDGIKTQNAIEGIKKVSESSNSQLRELASYHLKKYS